MSCRMLKRIISAIIVLSFVFSLVSCNENSDETSSNTNDGLMLCAVFEQGGDSFARSPDHSGLLSQ